jgi:phage gpG-like protein
MQVVRDDWSGLFSSLAAKASLAGRAKLLAEIIGDVKTMTLANFGEMADGMMRPWREEQLLSENYKRVINRDFATLERSEEERSLCYGTKWEGGQGEHLKDSFIVYSDDSSASLTNFAPYASNHQLGEGVPRRPFFPIDETGELMPQMQKRILGIADSHFQT